MVPTSITRIRSLFRPRRVNSHPDAVPEASLNLLRRIDDPTSTAQLTRDLLRNHREYITMALYLDDRHRLVGTAILTGGWVQAARLSARSSLGPRRASPAPVSSSATAATAATGLRAPQKGRSAPSVPSPQPCSRYGVVVADHVIVVG